METLRLPATLESLKPIRDYVTLVANTAGIGKTRAYGLALAVDEIATNIITHGYEEAGRTGDIIIHAQVTEGVVEITMEDAGVPFDPWTHANPESLNAPLEDRGMGGLGIFLAQKNVDEFRYDYVNGHNRNTFVIRMADTNSPSARVRE
jgi:serine/threonine-protein kinase RsbW